jgi:hypothetical protein
MGWVRGQARTAGRRWGECKNSWKSGKADRLGRECLYSTIPQKLHFFESLFVLCYTLFAWISAVFAECGDSVVRAGFLVLFIREKYGKKRIMINLLLFLLS